jgi:DNA/RNA-binding domain of Phe-tRNA-synthetase-like protein
MMREEHIIMQFGYHPDIIAKFPTINSTVLMIDDVHNGPSSDEVKNTYQAEQEAVLARIGQTPLSQLPSLAAWRATFRKFGVDPTTYRCAAEALLRRLTKAGNIPSINTLVDLGNLVSIRYGVPIAVLDRRDIANEITVRFAEGYEQFYPFGEDTVDSIPSGEVIFRDSNDLVLARRWCWKQSAPTAARDDTTTILITIEAQHAEAATDVELATRDLTDLLVSHVGGKIQRARLNTYNQIASFTP